MKMKSLALLVAILSIVAGATGAEARSARSTHRESSGWSLFGNWGAPSAERARPQRAHRNARAPRETSKSFFGGWGTSARAERAPQPRAHRAAARAPRATASAFSGGFRSASLSTGGHSAGPRPAKWCGWYMRTQLGGGAEYNIARNWNRYGRPTGPQVGAVVVWPHHVGMITGKSADGKWIVKSGNYSGGVREVPMNVKGASFRI